MPTETSITDDPDGETDDHSDGPTITFGPSAAEDVVEELGFAVNDAGVIVDESGEPVEPAFGDAPIRLTELGGFGTDEDGEIFVISDDFTSIVEYVNQFGVTEQPPTESVAGESDVE